MDTLVSLQSDRTSFYQQTLSDWQQSLLQDQVPIHIAPRSHAYEAIDNGHFHSHPEIFLQIHGSNAFTFHEGSFIQQAGELAIIPSGVPHAEVYQEAENGFCCIVIMPSIHQMGILAAVKIDDHIHQGEFHSRFDRVPFEHMCSLLDQCEFFLEQDNSTAQHLCATVLNIFKQGMHKPIDDETELKLSPLIRQCRHIIQQHFYESDCNVQSLAQMLECTPNYLSAKFKKECNSSLNNYLNRARLMHAQALLQSSGMSIQHIAWSSGFNSPSYFTARYREYFKETPANSRTKS